MNTTAALTAAHCANPDTVARLTLGQPVNSVCASAWKDIKRTVSPYCVKGHIRTETEHYHTPAAALARLAELNAHLTAPLSA